MAKGATVPGTRMLDMRLTKRKTAPESSDIAASSSANALSTSQQLSIAYNTVPEHHRAALRTYPREVQLAMCHG